MTTNSSSFFAFLILSNHLDVIFVLKCFVKYMQHSQIDFIISSNVSHEIILMQLSLGIPMNFSFNRKFFSWQKIVQLSLHHGIESN